MSQSLEIRKDGALDLVSLGALVHRLDPGIIPFRKATQCQIHVSGGEFNVAANLADCFRHEHRHRHRHGGLPHRRPDRGARARHGRQALLQALRSTTACTGPNMATVYSDRGYGVRAPVVFYNRSNEAGGAAEARAISIGKRSSRAACAGSIAAASSPRFRRPRRSW